MAETLELSTVTLELRPGPFGDLSLSPYEEVYGEPEREGTMAVGGLQIRLGDRPLATNLRRLHELGHKELPLNLASYDKFDLWLITHVVGVVKRHGSADLRMLGYEIELDEPQKVYTIEVLPQSRFVTRLGASLGASVDLGLEGHAMVPEEVRELLDAVKLLGGDARFAASADAQLLGRLSFGVVTPTIQAVGMGSTHCEWCFQRDGQPLLGDQLMVQIIAVPSRTRALRFKARGYAAIKRHWFSFYDRLETEWMAVECGLGGGA